MFVIRNLLPIRIVSIKLIRSLSYASFSKLKRVGVMAILVR